jgi:hypothetical protein
MKKLIPFVFSVLIFCSCSTSVYLTRTVPPELVPDNPPARVVFSNQFDYLSNPGIKDKHEIAYQTGILQFAETLTKDSLHENPVVIFLTDTLEKINRSEKLYNNQMPVDQIRTICKAHEAGYLLSLDSLRLHFEWETIRDEDPDGSVSKEKYFYLLSNYYVTLYDSAGGLFKRTLLEKSLLYTSRPTLTGLITIQPNLANGLEKIKKLAIAAGIEYLNMFYPSVETYDKRTLYSGKFFEETNLLIKQQEYDKASEKLMDMTNSPKTKLAMKARHNLSVAQELKAIMIEKDKE